MPDYHDDIMKLYRLFTNGDNTTTPEQIDEALARCLAIGSSLTEAEKWATMLENAETWEGRPSLVDRAFGAELRSRLPKAESKMEPAVPDLPENAFTVIEYRELNTMLRRLPHPLFPGDFFERNSDFGGTKEDLTPGQIIVYLGRYADAVEHYRERAVRVQREREAMESQRMGIREFLGVEELHGTVTRLETMVNDLRNAIPVDRG